MGQKATVFNVLGDARAQLLSKRELGFGRSLAFWHNQKDCITYDNQKGHAISLYLKGGAGTTRVDRNKNQGKQGQQGAMCIFPQGAYSRWDVSQPFEFVHLYLPDEELRYFLSMINNADPQNFSLLEQTYIHDDILSGLILKLMDACHNNAHLEMDAALVDILAQLTSNETYKLAMNQPQFGGLSPQASNRAIEYMAANFDRPIRLRDIAAQAGQSEFHFQRMFKKSHGLTPSDWIERYRIAKAKALMMVHNTLAQTALDCGYSSQSHFTRAFVKATGSTPGKYRQGQS